LYVGGGPLPVAGIINDNDNGIESYAKPNNGDHLYYYLTNRTVGSASVTGAVTADLFTQDLGATPGVYNFSVYVSGFESTTPAGCAFTIFGSIRTTGAAATLIVTEDVIADKETALEDVNMEIVVSGNNAIVRATGQAGLTINFKALANYIFVG
jgi:hypothetical protein